MYYLKWRGREYGHNRDDTLLVAYSKNPKQPAMYFPTKEKAVAYATKCIKIAMKSGRINTYIVCQELAEVTLDLKAAKIVAKVIK